MKWYNYYKTWIDISKCTRIDLDEPNMEIYFFEEHDWNFRINFSTRDEYKVEEEKIKMLMGVSVAHNWTPGRCC